jgi:hypothetical protein
MLIRPGLVLQADPVGVAESAGGCLALVLFASASIEAYAFGNLKFSHRLLLLLAAAGILAGLFIHPAVVLGGVCVGMTVIGYKMVGWKRRSVTTKKFV